MTYTGDLLRQLRNAQATIEALQDELNETNRGLIALMLELERREERLRTVVSNAPILLLALDRHGTVTLAEGQGLTTLGLQPGQMVGHSAFDLFPEVPETREHVRRAMAGEVVTALDRLGSLDFETHWLPLRDHSGQVDETIGVATDVTERRRAEQRTRAALDALLVLAEAIVLPAGDQDIPEAGTRGRRLAELTLQVLDCQHVAIVALAPGTDEIQGVAIAGFTSAEAQQWWRQWDARPRLSERLEATYVARLHRDDVLIVKRTQALFPPEMALARRTVLMAPLRVEDRLSGILSVDYGLADRDFTPDEIALVRAAGRLVALVLERERLLREQTEARANALALREANRRMEEFLSLAGHELRTPLTSVLGNLQLADHWIKELQRQSEQQPARQSAETVTGSARLGQIATLLERMARQGGLLNRLVDDLLDTSRIHAGRLALRRSICDLAAVVRAVVNEHQQRVPHRSLHLDIPDGPVSVSADGERISQVVTNYLSNALKYAPPGLPITVGLHQEHDAVQVWVHDAGPGLPAAEQARIWERFYRVAGIGHQDGSSVGLGLGLYISRNIVEQHGGQVGVTSSAGSGATFWFTLPLARADVQTNANGRT